MRSVIGALSVVLIGLLAAGCSRNRVETVIDPDAPTEVMVDNQSFPDMTIYVLEGARRIRLGMAGGHTQTKFILPKHLVRQTTSLRFQADPIGSSRAPVSDEITVSPGDQVTLRIPPA
jgi:hypothetical protein